MTHPAETEDEQRRAYTEAGPDDWAALTGDAVVHRPGDPDAPAIKTPAEWDAEGWDDDRVGPKTVAEARAALAERIADPRAPDTEAVAGAYDDEPEG